jgi:hypothetical protein
MVIQQNMARIPSPYYHASTTVSLANHSDFFNTHRRLHSEPRSMSVMGIFRQQPLDSAAFIDLPRLPP